MPSVHRRSRMPGIIDLSASGKPDPVALVTCNANFTAGGSTLNLYHTVGSGIGRLLLVSMGHNATPLDWVKCDGVAMTQFGSTINAVAESHVDLFYKINPDAGSNYITAQSPDSNDYWSMGVADYINVNQITPLASYVGNTETDGSPTIDLTGAEGDLAFSWIEFWYLWTWATLGDNMTEIYANNLDNAWRGQGATKAGAATVQMAWTLESRTNTCCCGVMIKGM